MSRAIKTIILFAIGFCSYITLEVLFRGFSFPLMGVCGGISILVLDKINDNISWNVDLLLQGIIGSIFISGLEFIIGTLSLTGYLPLMWDYSTIPLNYRGIVCLPFSALWVFLSIIAIFIADAYNYYVLEQTQCPYYILFGKVCIKFKEIQRISRGDDVG